MTNIVSIKGRRATDPPPHGYDMAGVDEYEWNGFQMVVKTTNKYGAERTLGVNGIWFRSKLEANYAQELELCRHAEDPKERVEFWVYEIPFYLPTIRPKKYVQHVVDFLVGMTEPPGAFCLVETKGKETPTGRVKRYWLETYLGEPIRVVERMEG